MGDNSNDVRARIIVEGLSQAIASLQSLKGAFKDLDGAGANMGSGARELNTTLGDVQTSMGNVKSLVLEIGAGILAWKAYTGVKDLVEYGVKYNATLETSRIGIAALITANEDLIAQDGRKLDGAEKFAAAQKRAADITKDLQIANLQTIATLPQMVEAYQQAIGPGLAAGLSSNQVEKLVVSMTKAAGTMGIDMNRLPEEIRSILQATVTPRMSRVAEATLGAEFGSKNVNNVLRQWMQLGTLFDELEKRFKAFDAAGQATQQSWNGVMSNIKDVLGMVMGGGQQDFFDYLKKDLQDLMSKVATFNQETGKITINPEVLDKVKELGDDMKQLWGILKDIGAFVFQHTEAIKNLAIAIGAAFAITKIVQFGAALAGLLSKINDVWLAILAGESSFNGILLLLSGPVGILAAVVAIGAALVVWLHNSEAIQKVFAAIAGDAKTFAPDNGTQFVGAQEGYGSWYKKGTNIFGVGAMSTEHDNPTVKEVSNHKPAGVDGETIKRRQKLIDELLKIQQDGINRESKARAEEIKTELMQWEDEYKDNTISLQDFYDGKRALAQEDYENEKKKLAAELDLANKTYDEKKKVGFKNAEDEKKALADLNDAYKNYSDGINALNEKSAQESIKINRQEKDELLKGWQQAYKSLDEIIKQKIEKQKQAEETLKLQLEDNEKLASIEADRAKITGDMQENLDAQLKLLDAQEAIQQNDLKYWPQLAAASKAYFAALKADLAAQKEEGIPGFIDGWKKAFADYVRSAQTSYQMARESGQQFISSFQNDFSGLVQGLIQGTSNFKDFFKNLVNDVVKIWSDMVAKMVTNYLTGLAEMDKGSGGNGSIIGSVLGAILNGIGGAFGGSGSGVYDGGTLIQAANGGILPGSFMPFRAFAFGGIASSPTLGLIGEGQYNEAVVPLPDGKTIPVSMKGKGGGDTIIHFTQQLLLQPFDGPSAKAWLQTEGKDTIKNVTLDAVTNDMGFAAKVRGK